MIEYIKTGETGLKVAGKVLDFEYDVEKVLEADDMLIILLGNSDKYVEYGKGPGRPFNGVYAVSENGEILWNIEVFFRPGRLYNDTRIEIDYKFTDILIDDDGNLVAYTNTGKAFVLNINQKQIIGYFISRRKRRRGEYNIRRNTILEIAGREIDFRFFIKKIIETDNIIIVHLWDPSGMMYMEPVNGIYGVSNEGEILWNIEEFFRPGAVNIFNCYPIDFFTDANMDDATGHLVVDTYCGNRYVLDMDKMHIKGLQDIKSNGKN